MSVNLQLQSYLKQLEPILGSETYVFVSVSYDFIDHQMDIMPQLTHNSLSFFREKEGVSAVIAQAHLDKWPIEFQHISKTNYRCITLNVHSDLESVGLTAAVAHCLAAIGVSANVIAGYFHDHILIPSADAEKAFLALTALSDS